MAQRWTGTRRRAGHPWAGPSLTRKKDYKKIVDLLISQKADVDFKDDRGRTPLFYAVKNGDIAMMKLLKEKGAKNMDPHESHGVTALARAVRDDHLEAANLLMEWKADVHFKDGFGHSVLQALEKKHEGSPLRSLLAKTSSPLAAGSAASPTAAVTSTSAGDL